MSKEKAQKRFYRADSVYDFLSIMDRGQAAMDENRWTFESAWEVANKGKTFISYHSLFGSAT